MGGLAGVGDEDITQLEKMAGEVLKGVIFSTQAHRDK